MKFTVGATPMNVTSLGRIYVAGNNGQHVVKLVRVSDGADVPNGSVNISFPAGSPGQFTYVQLPSPVTLTANTSYFLVSTETAGGDFWYDIVTGDSCECCIGEWSDLLERGSLLSWCQVSPITVMSPLT